MSRQRGFTRASALGPISQFVEHQGGLIARVFERVDVPIGILNEPDLPLPLAEQFKVLQSAARETGDPFFGARLGQLVRIEQLSAFGKWVSEAPDIGGAIARSNAGLNRYLQTGTNLALTLNGPRARWSIEFLDPGFNGRFHNELLGISYLIDVFRSFLGRRWHPYLVRITGTTGNQAAPLEEIFGAPVLAGCAIPAIEFPTALLTASRPGSALNREEVDALDDGEYRIPADSSDEVQAMISLALLDGYPRIDWVASKLGMTRRSLQRRLKRRDETFSRLAETHLHRRAEQLLQTPRPITEIAYELGYSDPAHFTRAFRKWNGVSPSAYRASCLEPG